MSQFQLTRCPFCEDRNDYGYKYRDFGKDFFQNTYRCGRCERSGKLSELHEDLAWFFGEEAKQQKLSEERKHQQSSQD